MATEFTLDPRDREVHGGPEWVTLDRDALDELPFDKLDRWEKELGISIAELLSVEFPRASALGVKGVVWLARQMSGAVEPRFAQFNIRPRLVRYRAVRGDARPPAQGSSEPSQETAQ